VDVRPCRPEDPMSLMVQTKKDNETKWNTAGKVTVVIPAMWVRISITQKEDYLNESFTRF
jgi:hypothetical protein